MSNIEKQNIGTYLNEVQITSLSHINGQPQAIEPLKVHIQGYFNMRAAWPDKGFAKNFLRCFGKRQTGKAGDITAGLPPVDYTFPYIEWYGEVNGRVVIEFEPSQIEIIGRSIPVSESDPISRQEQERNMADYLNRISKTTGIPSTSVICVEMPTEEGEP